MYIPTHVLASIYRIRYLTRAYPHCLNFGSAKLAIRRF